MLRFMYGYGHLHSRILSGKYPKYEHLLLVLDPTGTQSHFSIIQKFALY
jgi:hypothetical protein